MAWRYVNGRLEEFPDPPPPTAEEIRAQKLALLPKVRFFHETKGITVGTTQVATDRDSQGMITRATISLNRGFIPSTPFKGRNGWTTVNSAQMDAIGAAVAQHVSACFAHEKALEDLLAISEATDINFGWPGA